MRSGSFHTGWDLGILSQADVVAVAPRSVTSGLAEGVAAVPLSEPTDLLDTRLLWRDDDPSPAVQVLRSAALSAFDAHSARRDGP